MILFAQFPHFDELQQFVFPQMDQTDPLSTDNFGGEGSSSPSECSSPSASPRRSPSPQTHEDTAPTSGVSSSSLQVSFWLSISSQFDSNILQITRNPGSNFSSTSASTFYVKMMLRYVKFPALVQCNGVQCNVSIFWCLSSQLDWISATRLRMVGKIGQKYQKWLKT